MESQTNMYVAAAQTIQSSLGFFGMLDSRLQSLKNWIGEASVANDTTMKQFIPLVAAFFAVVL
jgi:hypothetical protein